MRTLAVDIGTGTQDIFLFDSRLPVENGLKLVLPSPTMIVHRRIKDATERRVPIVLMGLQMGGGPSAWAAEAHARAGLPVFATPEAALTLDDDPVRVSDKGVRILAEPEANRLPAEVARITLRDFDFPAIEEVFTRFGVSLENLDAVAVAVFDHGAAPPGSSDRQFRFDYLDNRLRARNSLSSFAYEARDVPAIMSRLRAVASAAAQLRSPLVVMDTAPAAVLGATFDRVVASSARTLIVNIGNFHTLAFRMNGTTVEGLFEHHTGELGLEKLQQYLASLADGSLRHDQVFKDMGHGALMYSTEPLGLGTGEFDVVVTGPRRGMFAPKAAAVSHLAPSLRLRPYFAVPFGDMMITGCIGLLAATADVLPNLADEILGSLSPGSGVTTPPWEVS